jgi:GAF domain-containing protein
MDCDRAFLSLIDNRNQFICAEMTKHQSLVGPDPTQPLLLGVAQIALEWGVCSYTMSIFQGKPVDIPETPYIVADPSYFYIEDFRRIPSFATRPYVAGYPSMVSYMEVPLRSLSGHLLGSYCVVDNKSRDFTKPETLATIRDVTSAIGSYLNLKRVDAGRTRSERVIDGLRQFIGSERQTPSLRVRAAEVSKPATNPFGLDVFNRASQNEPISCATQNLDNDQLQEVSSIRSIPLK